MDGRTPVEMLLVILGGCGQKLIINSQESARGPTALLPVQERVPQWIGAEVQTTRLNGLLVQAGVRGGRKRERGWRVCDHTAV